MADAPTTGLRTAERSCLASTRDAAIRTSGVTPAARPRPFSRAPSARSLRAFLPTAGSSPSRQTTEASAMSTFSRFRGLVLETLSPSTRAAHLAGGPTGDRLFYWARGRMMVVAVQHGSCRARRRAAATIRATRSRAARCADSPDGRRFLSVTPRARKGRSSSGSCSTGSRSSNASRRIRTN